MNEEKKYQSPGGQGSAVSAFNGSIGFQIRHTHGLLQRHLQMQIEPHGLTLGTWYLLRVLWEEDGLTQRELSKKVGRMEPTTLVAIKSLIASGLVERRRDPHDSRKFNVLLTQKGRALKDVCIPKAMEVNATAGRGISDKDRQKLFEILSKIQTNIQHHIERD